jgi:peptidoglycan/LPS O-acetylase OafA/YrhL
MHWNLFDTVTPFATGVQLFMVLSGFCLFWPICKSAEALASWDWETYARRRLRRIVPPYYAAILYTVTLPMVLVMIFWALRLDAKWQPLPSVWQFVTHVFFIHTFFPETWNGITGAFWSLGLEAQFYVVFPLVILGFRKLRLRMIAVMIGVSILFRVIVGTAIPEGMNVWKLILSITFLGQWMLFAAGMLVAWLVAKDTREGRVRGGWVGTVGIVCALGLYVVATQNWFPAALSFLPIMDLLLSVSFGILIFALCTSRTPLRGLFRNKAMTRLGLISYSIYLIHQPTVWYFSEMLRKRMHVTGLPEFLVLCTAGFALLVAISNGFFVLFELPFLTAPRVKTPESAAPSHGGVTWPMPAAGGRNVPVVPGL